jgi:hypothetical protein
MEENITWSVWKEENSSFSFGPKEFSKEKNVVEEFQVFEEAKEAWKFYNFFLINNNEQK